MISKLTYWKVTWDIYSAEILVFIKAKNAGIALAIASILNV